MSLSKACEFILGKELAKNQRMSDWNGRPLTPDQVVYASLDAHCMLSILGELLHYLEVDAELGLGLGLSAASVLSLDDPRPPPRDTIKSLNNPSTIQIRFINSLQSKGWIQLFST